MAQLSCPNVVQIFDYGVENDTPFIVMEMLQGEDLRVRLKKERLLSVDKAADLLWQTSKALGVAHGEGIIHRDLKPGNIFLVQQGHDELVKVLDFGVAKTRMAGEEQQKKAGRAIVGKPLHRVEAGEHTQVGTLLGTPHYMSPEQILGEADIDHRADLWSMGVILYRALTGRLPFNLRNADAVMKRIITSRPPACQRGRSASAAGDRRFLRRRLRSRARCAVRERRRDGARLRSLRILGAAVDAPAYPAAPAELREQSRSRQLPHSRLVAVVAARLAAPHPATGRAQHRRLRAADLPRGVAGWCSSAQHHG